MHGGKNSGAPKGNRNAWKHGARSAEVMAASSWQNAVSKLLKGGEL